MLREPGHAVAVLDVLDSLTRGLRAEPDPATTDVRVLRKALGYCWSVAVVVSPEAGRTRFASIRTGWPVWRGNNRVEPPADRPH